jgi:hypothetical protein
MNASLLLLLSCVCVSCFPSPSLSLLVYQNVGSAQLVVITSLFQHLKVSCLSLSLPGWLFFCLSVCPSVYLFLSLSLCLCLSISIHLSIYLSIYLSVHLPLFLSPPSFCLCFHVYLSIHLYLSVCLSFCLLLHLFVSVLCVCSDCIASQSPGCKMCRWTGWKRRAHRHTTLDGCKRGGNKEHTGIL